MSARATTDIEARLAVLEAELDTLRDERDRAVKARAAAEHEREQYRKLYALVQFELERMKRQLFGKKAETVNPAQIQLAFTPVFDALSRAEHGDAAAHDEVEAELAKLRDAAAKTGRRSAKSAPKKPHGRRDLSDADLPVETVVLEPPERALAGGDALVKIGEEISEHLDRRAASVVRVRVVRPKYRAASDAESTTIVIADMPERPIPRGIAGPGLLAHVVVQKFADHVPLHRQEVIFRRDGVHMPRSTLAGLVQGATSLLGRVVDAMWADAKKNARWLAVDATGVLVLAREQCKRGHFWVVVAERDHVLFRYTKKHDGTVPIELLDGFKGHVIADASSVYHALYRSDPEITEVGCWAHARRRFFDALPSDRERALVGIGFIGLLYEAHRAAMDPDSGVVDTSNRRDACTPILEKLYRWIADERPKVIDEAPIAKAMNYLVNHREPLSRFLDDGHLRLDNNVSELELRRQVVGRKNWLFCGSDDGAHWNATATSLIASCQLHGIEPWAYLRDVLTLLPTWPLSRALELSPKGWNETRKQTETQQRLRALRLLGRDEDGHAAERTV